MHSIYYLFVKKVEDKFRIDAHYFFKGGFWLSVGQGATILSGLLTTALFAHFLTENKYGEYRYLIGLAALLGTLSLTGLGQAVLQTAAKKYFNFYRETLKINFIFSMGALLFSLGFATYYLVNKNITLAIGCLLIALIVPLSNVFKPIFSFLQGTKQYKKSTTFHIIRMLLTAIIISTTLLFTQNILLLFLTYLLTDLSMNIVGHLIFSPKPTTKTPSHVLQRYLSYAKHTSARNILSNIAQRADTIVIFTHLGAAELALYTIATVVPEQLKSSLKNLSVLLLPKYAEHKDVNKIMASVPKRSIQLFVLLSIITIIYILIAPYLYNLIFPKYPEAAFYSQLAALAFPAFIIYIPYNILQAQLAESVLYRLTLFGSVLQLSSLFILTFTFGLLGAIIAKVLYRFIYTFASYYLLYKNKNS